MTRCFRLLNRLVFFPQLRPSPGVLALLGALTLPGYAWIAWRYPLWDSFQWPRGGWFPPERAEWGPLPVHLAVYLALTLLWMGGLHVALALGRRGERLARGLVVGIWLTASLLLLAATPAGDSHDVYDYLYRGRLLVEQGVSPLAVAPQETVRQAFYRYTAWKRHVDTYGPVWEYASGGVSWLVQQGLRWRGAWAPTAPTCPLSERSCVMLAAYVTGYRLLSILLAGVTGFFIYRLVSREEPAHSLAALVYWLWNPVVILATALGAHNDALMLVWLVGGLLCLQARRPTLAWLALLLAAHVKLTALIWAPLWGLWLWRQQGLGRAVGSGVVALAVGLPVSWLLYRPLGGWETLPRMLQERMLFVANSPWQLAYHLLREQGWPLDVARFYTIRVPTYLFVLLAVAASAWLAWRGASDSPGRQLWRGMLLVALLYLAVGSFWFQHWYVLWAAAPAALLPHGLMARRVLPWLGWGALASNVVYDVLTRQPEPVVSRTALYAGMVAIIWGPALLACAGLAWRRLRLRRLQGVEASSWPSPAR
ncbi:DUF2029 domain-containing protein [Litorilinea aerophila]|uniref:DUF2029 domain-containing protein n=1 Tax=Litorilinea aerophila TaxID=1204385 RepID=A0A540VJB6_9CHLR|nr:DUF2029 domain-containing protein [Litorilinea aerophila]MCC9075728.1 DUF2029 domain-containing protein [Litorilinea aerophila]OUC06823.1 hypothetical protein RY27_18640 [Litorilinea aerophila]